MLRIKRLYTFIIQTFVPVFMMTFAICLFIVLMQFIWRYVEDLVGKGLDNVVLAELFLYAALQLVPMALPLSLLLASLMTFGNLGERLELLAIKASGVSLLKAMRPLIILVGCIAIGGFFYQNEVMPRINVKLRSLLISIKQKSPELDIPEGSFYNGINNYSIYVKEKDKKTKILRDVIIYDTSKGFDNMTVFVCDSALMKVSEDKKFLVLNLLYGQQFANFRQADLSNTGTNTVRRNTANNNKFVPYSRENFKNKEIIIAFNAGFDRMDESNLEGTQISKNIVELKHSIDSMSIRLDSINTKDRKIIGEMTYLTYRNNDGYKERMQNFEEKTVETPEAKIGKIDFDSLLNTFKRDDLADYYASASGEAENNRFNIIESIQKKNLRKNIRYHEVEWHQKFTLSFACLIFFFIGAPLGAIIRKGGLGMPVVVSVCLFIVYYIINNIGYKMARDGIWEVWQGMWLSSAVLFPLGVFLTYKAMNDSSLFNPEAYGRFFRRILLIKDPGKLSNEERSRIIAAIPASNEIDIEKEALASLQTMDSDKLRDIVKNYVQYGYTKNWQTASFSILKERGAELDDLIGSRSYELANDYYRNFNKSSIFTSVAYFLSLIVLLTNIVDFSLLIYIIYLIFFIRSMMYYQMFYKGIAKSKIYYIFVVVFSFVGYPALSFFIKKKMEEELQKIRTQQI